MKTRILSFALFLFGILTSHARGQSSLEKIVITYPSRSIASVDLYIAQDRGYFRQEGLQAEASRVREISASRALLIGDPMRFTCRTIMPPMERSELPRGRTQSFKIFSGWSPAEIKASLNLKENFPSTLGLRNNSPPSGFCKRPGWTRIRTSL